MLCSNILTLSLKTESIIPYMYFQNQAFFIEYNYRQNKRGDDTSFYGEPHRITQSIKGNATE